ncbi:unnamed protein product [Adineta ricciae]|uniref:Myb-like domain-containing protein n=1 Tax=Adineta ricciae TaxID=249248 RepID=A0A815ZVU8_ADIRI|nr:unnamed protein product [Adineta ricciae]
MITRSRSKLTSPNRHTVTVCQPPLGTNPETTSAGVDGGRPGDNVNKKRKKVTVDIHAVTQRTQSPEKSPSGQSKGPSTEISVKQSRVGQWTSREEEELKQLATLHTDPKGKVCWAKVVEAWSTMKLPIRSKASLSSKWSDIRARAISLDAANEQDNTVLAVTTGVGVQQHQNTGTDNSQEVNRAVSPKKKKKVVVVPAGTPSPVKDNLKLDKIKEKSEKDPIEVLFAKYLKKSRKIGCEVYRKPTRRIIPNFGTQSIIDKVDLIMSDQIIRKMNGEPTWNQLSILVYAGALTVEKLCNQASEDKRNRSKIWFSSTYKEVDRLRKIIGKASAELNRRKADAEVAPTAQQLINIRLLERKYKCKSFDEITSLVEKLKGRLQLLLARIELRKTDEQRLYTRCSPTKVLFRGKDSQDSQGTC